MQFQICEFAKMADVFRQKHIHIMGEHASGEIKNILSNKKKLLPLSENIHRGAR